jgi:hypothetical protein
MWSSHSSPQSEVFNKEHASHDITQIKTRDPAYPAYLKEREGGEREK